MKSLYGLLLPGAALLLGGAGQPAPDAKPPIIDMHLHAYESDPRWAGRVPNPATGKPLTATDEKAHRRATLAELKHHNIVKAVLSNGTGAVEVVDRWKAAAPDVIIPSPGFDGPHQEAQGGPAGGAARDLAMPPPEPGALRRDYLAGRFAAMGEIGAVYAGLALDDSRLEPYFALAEELDIPVAVHTGISSPNTPYQGYPRFRAGLGNPLPLEAVLVRHPKLRIYLQHAGYPYLQETKALMLVYPQVYADLAAIDWIIPREEFHEYLRGLMRAGLGKRLMFGSDQMVWPEAIGMAIEGIESADFLTADQKRDIFYNNAVRFLRLDEKRP